MNVRIEHLAIWTRDLDRLRDFYARWFGAVAGPRYENPGKRFASCFLSFAKGPRLELMTGGSIAGDPAPAAERRAGFTHLAIALGSRDAVDDLTARMSDAGVTIVGAPRWTGDGYYESVVADPDGNLIELTA